MQTYDTSHKIGCSHTLWDSDCGIHTRAAKASHLFALTFCEPISYPVTVQTLSHDLNQPLNIEPDYYDLVISTVTLQFLNPERIPDLLVEIQNTTKMNGYHLLVFPVQSKLYSLPDSFIYLPKKDELYHAYQDSGWSILEYKESVGHLHKQDDFGRPIQGLFGFLLAQKIV